MWAYRHKLQNEAYNVGKTLPLDLRTSLRFEAEFERALEQRGREAAKAAMGGDLVSMLIRLPHTNAESY